MSRKKIDLQTIQADKQDPQDPVKSAPAKKRWPMTLLKVSMYVLVFLLILGFSFSYKVIFSSDGVFSRQETGFFDQLKHLVTSSDKTIDGEDMDRVNILLVGMGGPGHEGSYLADTIIIASLKPSSHEVAMLSIPRDFLVEIPGYGWRKINNANAFGYFENPDKGGERFLASIIEDVIDQDIHYYASIDFSGFTEVIDLVNGVEIDVERSFTDYQYPDNNYGYQTVSFKAGIQTMDGETALKYVRSRHGTNGEGSDFARSRRQQQVLSQAKKEILSFGTLINPKKVVDISEALGSHLKTDMEIWEVVRLADLLQDIDTSKIVSRVLDTSPNGLLYSDYTADGAYVLQPVAGDYSEIQALAKNIFNYTAISKESAKIEIQNGTATNGLADTTANLLKDIGYNVVEVGNAASNTETTTIIYDLSLGNNPETLQLLKKELAAEVSANAPIFLSDSTADVIGQTNPEIPIENSIGNLTNVPTTETEDIDILIVLGSDILESQVFGYSANTNLNY